MEMRRIIVERDHKGHDNSFEYKVNQCDTLNEWLDIVGEDFIINMLNRESEKSALVAARRSLRDRLRANMMPDFLQIALDR